MGLFAECQARIPLWRLAQLTNPNAPQNAAALVVAGTVALVNGSAAVVGSGTTFTALTVGSTLQFATQPGVNYVILAITDALNLTLSVAYSGVSNASTTATSAGVNFQVLQKAVEDAQVDFETWTGDVYDDVTVTNRSATPPTVNRCNWIGYLLVIASLYEYRAQPWADAQIEKAREVANASLDRYLRQVGGGRWAAPGTDAVWNPSTPHGPYPILPDTDRRRFANWSANDPQPGGSGTGSGGGLGAEFGP